MSEFNETEKRPSKTLLNKVATDFLGEVGEQVTNVDLYKDRLIRMNLSYTDTHDEHKAFTVGSAVSRMLSAVNSEFASTLDSITLVAPHKEAPSWSILVPVPHDKLVPENFTAISDIVDTLHTIKPSLAKPRSP